ncbi:hypothetical protein L226DRAFT_512321 [Lentinus tigrinus ALCF2SS1-7]|uniref:Uncharacterized protein n=1 Tax=Lentinus tigrinus ALCF2SS1-6 TaxID=1328759 RepID=A0A5C2S1W1_9APHY|nr:hypothetical protein L227DRAFT_655571 [Lentinus tigrinus ALCF2SS1-6]RPD72113.1 hypothetical protein L226DRAFT_512321 [Lentinus tigrinus ALCF2SS1-7]
MSEHRPNTSPPPEGHGPAVVPNDARPTTDFQPAPPSETVQPTAVGTPPQQAATQPGSGPAVQNVVVEQTKPSFNQQVIGYAKEIRGTILRKHDTKDYGGKIRKGEEPWPPQPDQNDTTSSPTSANANPQ